MAELSGMLLSDGVVVLRPLQAADAADHLAGEDAELVRWLSGGVGTTDTVSNYIQHVQEMWANNGPIFTFAIRSAREDNLAGTIDIQLNRPAFRSDQANFAYGLYPGARGRGFATSAVHLALDFLRTNRAIQSALIRVDPDNPRSAAVAMRAGFTLTMRASDTDDGHDWYEREVH